ncbi:RluA family pseudouridine synthase [Aliidiomarina indica]|uniref:RluA family pseudouridine synthase n=1 Tax=Aliidiomarina indica TaxID=2749147 RepID=UPI00188E5F95|nr:RluA family pseudouridine synthase [Aliidiomarina indica]
MFVYNPPQHPWLDILWRDDDLLVLNKPAGLLSVPGKAPEHKDSLILRVQRALPSARVVHRLDMATSGIIVMALHKEAQGKLGQQFERRQITKHYRARVFGQLTTDAGDVQLPLRCDWPNRPKQMVCFEQGKSALTRYQVIARDQDSTDVQLFPVTGRSHQLRVHMQQLGHPILGDRLYGSSESTAAAKRLLLHAEFIAFRHPMTEQALEFYSPVPF